MQYVTAHNNSGRYRVSFNALKVYRVENKNISADLLFLTNTSPIS